MTLFASTRGPYPRVGEWRIMREVNTIDNQAPKEPLPLNLPPPVWTTVPAASEKYGIPKDTLYSAAYTGRILHRKFGGRLLLNIASCDKYAEIYLICKEGK